MRKIKENKKNTLASWTNISSQGPAVWVKGLCEEWTLSSVAGGRRRWMRRGWGRRGRGWENPIKLHGVSSDNIQRTCGDWTQASPASGSFLAKRDCFASRVTRGGDGAAAVEQGGCRSCSVASAPALRGGSCREQQQPKENKRQEKEMNKNIYLLNSFFLKRKKKGYIHIDINVKFKMYKSSITLQSGGKKITVFALCALAAKKTTKKPNE